jgi:glycerate 2-kinase
MRFPTRCSKGMFLGPSGCPVSPNSAGTSRRWLRTLATTTAAALFPIRGAYAWISTGTISSRIPPRRQFSFPPNFYPTLHQKQFSTSSHPLGICPTEQERRMTEDALTIVKQGIEAVDPYKAVRAHFEVKDHNNNELCIGTETTLDLDRYNQLVLVAFGKASSAMATAVVEQLQENDRNLPTISGLVICKDDHATAYEQSILETSGITVRFASHPVPDERSSAAALELVTLVQQSASPDTLIICCISGGGSALFCRPRPPLTLSDLQGTNSVLLGSGLGIQDMNVIRKRLEEGKGGRLAALSYPSTLVTLVLSDVLGDPLDLIASGPTVPDTSNWQDAWTLVHETNKNLAAALPPRVQTMLQDGMDGKLEDSPSPDHPAFQEAVTVLVGNNDLAVEAAAATAHQLGYQPVILGTRVEGEAKEMARMYVAMALYLQQQHQQDEKSKRSPYAVAASLPVALIAGGETTVSLPSNSTGKGGRNQELALSAALQMKSLGLRNVVLASVGTDGTDGPTDAAGAVVDGTTVSSSVAAAQNALSQHDAYTYLDGLDPGVGSSSSSGGDSRPTAPLIRTGPTGTNVADICVTLVQQDLSALR